MDDATRADVEDHEHVHQAERRGDGHDKIAGRHLARYRGFVASFNAKIGRVVPPLDQLGAWEQQLLGTAP